MPNVFVKNRTYERLQEIKAKSGKNMSAVMADVVDVLYANIFQNDRKKNLVSQFNRELLPQIERMPTALQDTLLKAFHEYIEEEQGGES